MSQAAVAISGAYYEGPGFFTSPGNLWAGTCSHKITTRQMEFSCACMNVFERSGGVNDCVFTVRGPLYAAPQQCAPESDIDFIYMKGQRVCTLHLHRCPKSVMWPSKGGKRQGGCCKGNCVANIPNNPDSLSVVNL